MKITNILSIGGCCDSLFLEKHLHLRYPGPVDNMGPISDSFLDTYKLFNKDFYNSVINDNYKFKLENAYEDFPQCHFDGFFMMHNDYRLSKTKTELINRLNNFNEYLNKAKNDKSLFFMYSAIFNDGYLNEDDVNLTLNKIPEYVKNRLIFINCRKNKVKNLDKFKIKNYPIFYCDDSLFGNKPDNYIIKLFNKWWKNNKKFYEIINNEKYELIDYV